MKTTYLRVANLALMSETYSKTCDGGKAVTVREPAPVGYHWRWLKKQYVVRGHPRRGRASAAKPADAVGS